MRLAGELLQFDGFSEEGLTFVSHAHVPVPPRSERMVTSVVTARLLGARARHALATPLGRDFSLGALELRLLPTGHVPGAAALRVGHEGRLLVYAGQLGAYGRFFGLVGAQPERCDTLVLDAPFARPGRELPPPQQVFADLAEFCWRALQDGVAVVLLCERLGMAQPLSTMLEVEGFRVRLHRSQHRYLAPLRDLGVEAGQARRFEGGTDGWDVLLWPVDLRDSTALPEPEDRRMALLSPVALEAHAAEAHGCHAAFPFSDHADFPRVSRYVKAAAPTRLYLLPDTPAELEGALAERGRKVQRFGTPAQLELFAT